MKTHCYIKPVLTEGGLRWEAWINGERHAASQNIIYVALYVRGYLRVNEEFHGHQI